MELFFIFRSLFSMFAEAYIPCVTESREVLKVNNFTVKGKPSDKLFNLSVIVAINQNV